MKNLISTILLTILILFKMDGQAQSFKTIETSNFKLEVYNASENSFGVASVIVSGKTDAVLIDAQFTLADAEKVAQEIKKSGKKLTTIYVSHTDPDFYFGLEVFKKYFPDVTAYASPATVESIKATAQKKLDIWGGRLGKAITSNVVLPQVLKGNSIELEGQKLEIVGLEEFPSKTFVWIPSIKAVVGGINVFGTTFNLWMADAQTTDARKNWINVLDKIEALKPTIVIPAHANANSPFDISAVNHTKSYIQFYEEALKTNKTSEDLIKALKEKYPTLTFDIALQIGAKVNTGEMKW
ncbi:MULTISPECIES: MBL fold metallo-hydrolase [unclassified Arcicella]|uniref:MBL fold metallo-hydrolase n=1 Tax=unclassified Arcicella TaxID=2644986 RepID=UPI002857F278|nr:MULTISPECIES: MBL fold metallo-hydrolase [unclassified Arcicella]MDR6562497.1 glyoxylase-like metal-dependent hydrolase (beta-lactamase superfamily II) [Arcicella sp. BE51]MDR6812584.1 glyoxylase-like metal-dependent hydrolase (beta-lactamase superfamily II) [Arcicella sp. BE140]MDR6823896.1 glyoxylase-like metal-dependent hydrolase (beta-lactamase superfamily II) [Arcicella sp. BE139]